MLFLDKLIKNYKGSESRFSLILGIIVVFVAGNQIIGYITNNLLKSTNTIDNSVEVSDTKYQDSSPTYVVQKGDYLYKIAQEKLGDGNLWPIIALENTISNPDIINVGDKLTIPAKEKVVDVNVEPIAKNNDLLTADKYTVVANDSLWTICVKAYGDGYQWPKVAKANNIANPNLLEKGQILVLPR